MRHGKACVQSIAHRPEKLRAPSEIGRVSWRGSSQIVFRSELIDLGCHDEVALAEAIDRVRP